MTMAASGKGAQRYTNCLVPHLLQPALNLVGNVSGGDEVWALEAYGAIYPARNLNLQV